MGTQLIRSKNWVIETSKLVAYFVLELVVTKL